MAWVGADWTIDRQTKVVDYVGDDHNGASPSYATVLEFHREHGKLADDEAYTGLDEHDITDQTLSSRATDNLITLVNGYTITDAAAEHLYDGSIVQGSGPTETIWDGIVNYGNPEISFQIIQDGAVLADDFWNYSQGGTNTAGPDSAFLTDSGFTTDEFVNYTVKNVTDDSVGLVSSNTTTQINFTYQYSVNGASENDWDASDAYLIAKGLNPDATQGISHRFLIKVRENGVDIDERKLYGVARRYGRTYAEFVINGTSRGNNVLALVDATDGNNATAPATVDAYTITNTEGLRTIDIDGDGTGEDYYSEWDYPSGVNQLYEYCKLISSDGMYQTLHGANGELHRGITHSIVYDTGTGGAPVTNDTWSWGTLIPYDTLVSGPFVVGDVIHETTATPVWKATVLAVDTVTDELVVRVESGTVGASDPFTTKRGAGETTASVVVGGATQISGGGSMKMLAVDGTTTGTIHVQILKGSAPTDGVRIYDDADTAQYLDVNVTVTGRTVSKPFCGSSTGSALDGAFGFGVVAGDATSADKFRDLTDTEINPPNNVKFTVSNLVAGTGADYVLVAPSDGAGNIDYDQMQTSTSNLTGVTTTVQITDGQIPSDTPTSGTIRIERDSGAITRHPYSAFDRSANPDTFTIDSHDFTSDNVTIGNNVFVTYLDQVATATFHDFTMVYNTDRTLFLRVRRGEKGTAPFLIKTYEVEPTFGSTDGENTVIRTSDE